MGKHSAAMNMAIDEALLRQSPQPVLRVYDWRQPTFSFGYFQQVADEVDVAACASQGIALVRRMTGGGTVVHGWDVTYTVIAPHDTSAMPKQIGEAYRVISDCLVCGLRSIGIDAQQQADKRVETDLPNVCLSKPARYDIMVDGKKVAGVSQRRNRVGVMYQGYIALDMPPKSVLALASCRMDFDRFLLSHSTAINADRDMLIARKALEIAIADGFKHTLGLVWQEETVSPHEAEDARELATTKYGSDAWNFRRSLQKST